MEIVVVKTESELKECLAIRRKVFNEEQQVPADIEVDDYDASPVACAHILARVDGVPAGCGRWIPYKEPNIAKIQRIAVLPEFRGCGVGARVMEALEMSARQAGMTGCILDSQCHAEPFYRRLGYRAVSEEPFEEAGIMHVRMSKAL